MKTYTQYETKYKIVNPNGVMLCNKYFENICEAEEEAMALTSINHNTNQGKFERVFIICVRAYAEYTLYEDIGLRILTKLNQNFYVCRESKLGMISVIISKYID